MQFQGVGGLVKTKVLDGDFFSAPWIRFLSLIPLRLTSPVTSDAPALATSLGKPGEIRQDGSFLYVCTAENTWKRAALNTF